MPERRKSPRNAELSSLFTFRITKVSTVTGIGGSCSRNPELSSLLNSPRLFASQKCIKVSTVTGIGGVVLAKPRTVVTFGLASSLRVSKVYKSVNSHRDRGGRARETQNCRHFWTRLVSSRLKSV